MSVAALHWAFNQRMATPQQQALLYVIADCADPSGLARQCDADYLAESSRLSRAHLLKCISGLRSVRAIETTEKFAEDGKRLFDIQLLLDKEIVLQRSDKPDGKDPPKPVASGYDVRSPEGKCIIALYDLAGLGQYVRTIMIRDGRVNYQRIISPPVLALADAPPSKDWIALTHQQAGAWEQLLSESVTVQVRTRLREGSKAPWPWPPRKDGTLSSTGPPETLMSDQDAEDFK
jgi:hypothetical protein